MQLYQVSGGGKSCEISELSSPLICNLTGLEAAKEYAVEAKACVDKTNCGETHANSAWTAPDGERRAQFSLKIIFLR